MEFDGDVDDDRPADDVQRDRPPCVVLARDVVGEQRDEVARGQVGLAHRGDPGEPEVTERHACLVDARHHGLLPWRTLSDQHRQLVAEHVGLQRRRRLDRWLDRRRPGVPTRPGSPGPW